MTCGEENVQGGSCPDRALILPVCDPSRNARAGWDEFHTPAPRLSRAYQSQTRSVRAFTLIGVRMQFPGSSRIALAALLVLPGVVVAQDGPVNAFGNPARVAPAPTTAAINERDLKIRLYQFADDSMMGRQVGRVGNMKGTDYIAAEVRRLGLLPAGDNGSYFPAAWRPVSSEWDPPRIASRMLLRSHASTSTTRHRTNASPSTTR